MRALFFFLLLLLTTAAFSQKGGINYPVLSKTSAAKAGYVICNNFDTLNKYCGIPGSKIYISASITLKSRIVVADRVEIRGDKKSAIRSNLWYATFRNFESFSIKGKNVRMEGLLLTGSDCDTRNLDTMLYQSAVRVYSDSFSIVNCRLECWGWSGVYASNIDATLIDQCYFLNIRNTGYGYAFYLEGDRHERATVRNCIFEGCREGGDSGGHLNYWSVTGCLTDAGITSHSNGNLQAGLGIEISGNYFYDCNSRFPAPDDEGSLLIEGNFYTRDTTAVMLKTTDTNGDISITGNTFNWNPPSIGVTLDSIVGSRHYFTLSGAKYYQALWGDETRTETAGSKASHSYPVGRYHAMFRGFGPDGVASEWRAVEVSAVPQNTLTLALKTTARFTPSGNYQVQVLVDGAVKLKYDASAIWKWKRVSVPVTVAHRISVRLVALKDSRYSCTLFVDDVSLCENQGFEQDELRWRQAFTGLAAGSGVTKNERASGLSSWRFEYRLPELNPTGEVIKKGTAAELYQDVD